MTEKERKFWVDLAHEQHHSDGVIEIDDDAQVSIGDEPIEGVYVQAWVWVNKPDQGD